MSKIDWSVFTKVGNGNAPLFEAAKAYRDAGFRVVPVETMGKKAKILNGDGSPKVLAFSASDWTGPVSPNIGLATGYDFWVMDVDGMRGRNSFDWLQSVVSFNSCSRVDSPNGHHYYFRTMEEGNHAQRGRVIPTCVNILPGIDIRGEKAIIVAPPSISSSGARYVTAFDFTPPTVAPSRLLELVCNAETQLEYRPKPIQWPSRIPPGIIECPDL